MAKLSLTVDSESGKFDVSINGQAVENVVGVHIYSYCDDYVGCSVQTATTDKKTGLRTITEHCFECECEDMSEADKKAFASEFNGFVLKPNSRPVDKEKLQELIRASLKQGK